MNDINHVIKEDKKMRLKTFVDHVLHKEIEPLIIHLSKNDDVN